MDLQKRTASRFYSGQGTSSTVAAPLVQPGFGAECFKGITIRAAAGNTVRFTLARPA